MLVALLAGGLPGCKETEPHEAAGAPDVRDEAPLPHRPALPEDGAALAPACNPVLARDGSVQLGGKETSLHLDLDTLGQGQLQVHPLDAGSVLVAWKPVWALPRGRMPTLDGKLWQLSCVDPASKAKVFFEEEGADFGNAVLSGDRRQLFYTGAEGVRGLDLATRKSHLIAEAAPLDEHCWTKGAKAHYLVSELLEGGFALRVEHGGPCGYLGAWVARERQLYSPDDPSKLRINDPFQVSAVAVDGRGRIWVGDAGRCDEPGVHDPQTHGALWYSSDMGGTWQYVPVQVGEVRMHTAVRLVFADASDPDSLLIQSAPCEWPTLSLGGVVYVTHDAGKTWTTPVGSDIGTPVEDGLRVRDVTILDGSVDHIVVWGADNARWKTTDGGETWTRLEPAPPPEDQAQRVVHGQYVFEVSNDGLVRKGDALVIPTRVFPKARD